MTKKKLNQEQIEILASSGLYDAILKDGSTVDFKSWMISRGLLDQTADGGIGSLWKEIQREIRDGVDMLIHKPLKVLPYLAAAAGLGAFGSTAQQAINGALTQIAGQAKGLIQSKSWTDLNRLIRTSLQATGVMPTTAMIESATQALIDQTVFGNYTEGQPIEIDSANIQWPRDGQSNVDDYLPFLIGGGVLVLVLVLAKR